MDINKEELEQKVIDIVKEKELLLLEAARVNLEFEKVKLEVTQNDLLRSKVNLQAEIARKEYMDLLKGYVFMLRQEKKNLIGG